MNEFDKIPLEKEYYETSWYSWPNSITVDQGNYYRTNTMSDFKTAEQDLIFDLCCSGDYLEVVDAAKTRRIKHLVV